MCRNPGKANNFRAKLITFRTAVIIILIQPHLVPKIRRSSSSAGGGALTLCPPSEGLHGAGTPGCSTGRHLAELRIGRKRGSLCAELCAAPPRVLGTTPPPHRTLGDPTSELPPLPCPHPEAPRPTSQPSAWHYGGDGSPDGGTVPGPPGLPRDVGSCGRSWRVQP